MAEDNLDLAMRRIRLGLKQRDIAACMGGFHDSVISKFERGKEDFLPARRRGERKQTRADYEAVLEQFESKRGEAA